MKRLSLKHFTLIGAMGFFPILSQTLLFRCFLSAFNGNELSIGFFFFSWLLWICAGAWLAKRKISAVLFKFYPYLLLLYIPGFIIQFTAFLNTQFITGTGFFETVSIYKVLIFVLFFNAPVSFLTGFLFVSAVNWIKYYTPDFVPVIKVYICEAVGSFTGALAVTVLLFFSFTVARVFIYAVIAVSLSSLPFIFAEKNKIIKTVYVIFTVLCIITAFSGIPKFLSRLNNRTQWNKLIHGGRFTGGFTTPQSKYIYGNYRSEFLVLSSGSIYESIPNYESSCKTAAEYLAQNPEAENVLVIGAGTFSLCRVFAEIPQIRKVTWADTDPSYSESLNSVLPDKLKDDTGTIHSVKKDIRNFISNTKEKYDIVVLYMHAPSNLLLNRYFTAEFFSGVSHILSGKGIAGINFPGGENFLGPELSFLGASVYVTLKKVFKNIVLKPGKDSIFFASENSGILTESGKKLAAGLKTIHGINNVYSPGLIRSSYETNRIEFQMDIYKNIIGKYPEKILFNSDKNPKSFFYSLLFSIKKLSDINYSFPDIQLFISSLFPFAALIIASYFLLRLMFHILFSDYKTGSNTKRKLRILCKNEIYLSVFIAAVAGMGINLLLMFLFQINYGTVYLCFGMITALFMLGMSINALTIQVLIKKISAICIFTFVTVLFILYMLLIIYFPPVKNIAYFAGMFFFAGAFCGAYFPLGGYFLKRHWGLSDTGSTSNLELCDHIGGAAGSLTASIILIPVIGIDKTLILFALIISAVLLHTVLIRVKHTVSVYNKEYTVKKILRVTGFILLGIAIVWCIFSLGIYPELKKKDEVVPDKGFTISKRQLHEIAGENCSVAKENVKLNNRTIPYYSVYDQNGENTGYIIRTKDFTDYVGGYAGALEMMSFLSPDGKIKNFTIINSNETPAYLKEVMRKKNIFLGENVFKSYKNYSLNAVTGATVTSKGISKTLFYAGNTFKSAIAPGTEKAGVPDKGQSVSLQFIVFAIFIMISVLTGTLKHKSVLNKKVRYVFLLAVAVLLGGLYNIQYSSDQVFALLSGKINFSGINIFLILTIGIPVLVILFGNLYCGFLCPFGALQELINSVSKPLSRKFNIGNRFVEKNVFAALRSLKYILLFILVILFTLTRKRGIAEGSDILLGVFSFNRSPLVFLSIVFLIISAFFNRFWCRILCPAGAFLSMFNGIHNLFKRKKTAMVTANCDLGVSDGREFDCIYCSRCLYNKRGKKRINKIITLLFIILSTLSVFIFLYFIKFESVKNKVSEPVELKKEKTVKPKGKDSGKDVEFSKPVKPIKSIGTPRKINLELYKKYIKKSYLSDHEAMYYRKLEE
ncbi:MAG: 4Fe-4S binding protein [Victivallales bacterium]|nr:4Fe-4S binding protein [Victivallales bacterium]